MRGELVVIRQGIAGEAVTLPSDGRFFVGRGQGAQLRFDDRGISTVHCWFERRGDQWFVADSDSRNGTYLNGKRVNAASLSQGDIVVLGETALLFRQRSGDTPTPSDTQVVMYPNEWRAGPEDLLEGDAGFVGEASAWERPIGPDAWRAVFAHLCDALGQDATIRGAANSALRSVAGVSGAERGLVAVRRGPAEGWRILATLPDSPEAPGVVASEAVLVKAVECRVGILTMDALADPRTETPEGTRGARSAVCVPFETRSGAPAVFYLDAPAESRPFAREHLNIARAACRVLALCPEALEK